MGAINGVMFTYVDAILFIGCRSVLSKLNEHFTAIGKFQRLTVATAKFPNSHNTDGDDNDMCAICLEAIDAKSKMLPCGHSLHAKCLRNLLEQRFDRCPVCRNAIG